MFAGQYFASAPFAGLFTRIPSSPVVPPILPATITLTLARSSVALDATGPDLSLAVRALRVRLGAGPKDEMR